MRVEDRQVPVVDTELRETFCQGRVVDDFVVEAVLGDDVQDGPHLGVVGRAHEQASREPAQFAAGLRLKLFPQGVGMPYERDVPAVVGLHTAEDPGLTAGRAAVVAGGEAVVGDGLGSAGRQPPGGLAADRSGTDDGDAFPRGHVVLSLPGDAREGQAAVRPTVDTKSMGWEEVPSSARSAAMSPKAGDSLKPWPENPASSTTLSAPGSGPISGRLLSV